MWRCYLSFFPSWTDFLCLLNFSSSSKHHIDFLYHRCHIPKDCDMPKFYSPHEPILYVFWSFILHQIITLIKILYRRFHIPKDCDIPKFHSPHEPILYVFWSFILHQIFTLIKILYHSYHISKDCDISKLFPLMNGFYKSFEVLFFIKSSHWLKSFTTDVTFLRIVTFLSFIPLMNQFYTSFEVSFFIKSSHWSKSFTTDITFLRIVTFISFFPSWADFISLLKFYSSSNHHND